MNREIDCVCLGSNLGIYPSLSQHPDSEGLLDSPRVIVKNSFLQKAVSCSSYTLQCPAGLSKDHYITELVKQTRTCIKDISNQFHKENHHIYLGGDHSISFISLTTSLMNYGSRLGYIQFDSHGDMNQWQTSPSKNFHGMYLRPFLDKFDIPVLDELVPQKIDPAHILFIGNLDLDNEEKHFFKKSGIRNIRKEDLLSSPRETLFAIELFISQFDHLHISFDIDIFHRDLVSSVATPALDGWVEDDVFKLLRSIFVHPHCSLDIVEFNPRSRLRNEDHSLRLVKDILANFHSTRKYSLNLENSFSKCILTPTSLAFNTDSHW